MKKLVLVNLFIINPRESAYNLWISCLFTIFSNCKIWFMIKILQNHFLHTFLFVKNVLYWPLAWNFSKEANIGIVYCLAYLALFLDLTVFIIWKIFKNLLGWVTYALGLGFALERSLVSRLYYFDDLKPFNFVWSLWSKK